MHQVYNEESYENSIVDLFENDLQYQRVYGPDIVRDFYNPLYEDVLLESIERINRRLPRSAIDDALYK